MAMKQVIKDFISGYAREHDFYQEAARLCHQRCEALLGPRGIKAIITYRAKKVRSLEEKVKERDEKEGYLSIDQIRRDIADLSGVRIALYFPKDRDKVKELIKDNFSIEDTKELPDKSKKREGKRFSGYHADHYRVYLPSSSLLDSEKRYADARIEIQVGSVLMHAWSEVEHDLIYKKKNGILSEDEHAILDELNGMVLSGEIALERLQRAIERRLSDQDKPFDSHYDLAAVLYKVARGLVKVKDHPMGRVDVLWELMRKSEMNNSAHLHNLLDAIKDKMEDRPIADQIADEILTVRPDLYASYVSLQSHLSGSEYYGSSASDGNFLDAPIGEFLSRWIILERTFTIIARRNGASGHNVYRDIRKISEYIQLSRAVQAKIDRLRMLRNHLVHGIEIPNEAYLRQASTELRQVLEALRKHPDEQVRFAYEEAREPIDKVA